MEYVKSGAASAVGESRLPIAFYGLSYIPLLLSLTVAGRYFHRKNDVVFLAPFKHFTTGLAMLLLALSWTHLKAVFPVAAINVAFFALLANTYRDPRYLAGMMASATIAVATWTPFVNEMQFASISLIHVLTSLTLFATALVATPRLDTMLLKIAGGPTALRMENDHLPTHVCFYFGVGLTTLLSVGWVLWVSLSTLLQAKLYSGVNYADLNVPMSLALVPLLALLLSHTVLTVRTRFALLRDGNVGHDCICRFRSCHSVEGSC